MTIGLFWLAVVALATGLMSVYVNTPGSDASAPGQWPAASHVRLNHQLPTLLMFIHPRCPCSRASAGELALLMAHCQGRVNAHVFFLRPAELDPVWVLTDTWRTVTNIPGVTVHRDDAGHEAQLFRAATSGDTLLYDGKGLLMFQGGITLSRGHSGDSPGRDA